MKIDLAGKTLIFAEEGLRLKAYLCQAKIPTIGVGCTYYPDGRKVRLGDTITKEEAYSLFDNVVRSFENAVNQSVKVPLTQNQFNALVSFSFNVGVKAFKDSTLLKKINSKAGEAEIRNQFNRWVTAGGSVNAGLSARRKKEANLYFKN